MDALTGWGYGASEVERLLLGEDQGDEDEDQCDEDQDDARGSDA